MSVNKTLVEFIYNNNILKIVKENYLNSKKKQKIDYCFVFTNSNTTHSTTLTRHKTISAAMKKFNKAVDAIKNGIIIK
jgi:hypothetical protein